MYLNINTNAYPVSEMEIRAAHPDTSFPQPFTPPDGYVWVFPAPQPVYDPITHSVVEISPVLTEKGHWEQQWHIVSLTPESVQSNRANKLASIQQDIINRTQLRLEKFAATRNYSSLESISKYKDISDQEINSLPEADRFLVTKFRTECRYLALATAQTWAILYRGLAEVEAGTKPMPTSFEEVEPELPVLVWPV